MKLKTIITTMLAVALIFSLSACSKNQSVEDPDKTDTDTQKTEQNIDDGETVDDTATADTSDADNNGADNNGADNTKNEDSWKDAFEKSLLENYDVVPESYEDLGNGIYQVYVKIDGKTVPYVTVDSATGEYHG